MERKTGTVVRGIRCPIIREGDNLIETVTKSVIDAAEAHHFTLNDRDIVAVTESVVARAQGNYVSVSEIGEDLKAKFTCDEIGVVFPILSRNRFAICLKAIAEAFKKILLILAFPTDEVGNPICDEDLFDRALTEENINPHTDVLTLSEYERLFGKYVHPFTGIDYIDYYRNLIEESGCEARILFTNNPMKIPDYIDSVLVCNIHNREKTKRLLKAAGAGTVIGLDEIMNKPLGKSGYNEIYGLLGSNKATEDKVKLFPRDGDKLVRDIQKEFRNKTGKNIEVMIYGDGAFKDPQGKIWELADPVVSPAFTDGLNGTPNELKLKYLADNDFRNLKGKELETAIKQKITRKEKNLKGQMSSQGTTPRHFTDLIGSLCDLTSGSGDKGTPVVLVQGYFDSYKD